MSNNILLTKYSMLDSGELSEKESINVDSAILSETIFEMFDESYISSLDILEEDSEEKYTQRVIDAVKITEILDFLGKLIREKMELLVAGKMNAEEEDSSLNELRELLNLRNVLLQKNDKYRSDNSVVLVIG